MNSSTLGCCPLFVWYDDTWIDITPRQFPVRSFVPLLLHYKDFLFAIDHHGPYSYHRVSKGWDRASSITRQPPQQGAGFWIGVVEGESILLEHILIGFESFKCLTLYLNKDWDPFSVQGVHFKPDTPDTTFTPDIQGLYSNMFQKDILENRFIQSSCRLVILLLRSRSITGRSQGSWVDRTITPLNASFVPSKTNFSSIFLVKLINRKGCLIRWEYLGKVRAKAEITPIRVNFEAHPLKQLVCLFCRLQSRCSWIVSRDSSLENL